MFIDGISSMVSKVVDTVKNVAGAVAGFLGFHSPTKEGPASDSDTWMPNMMSMLTQGIVDHTPKMQEAVNNVSLGLKSSFSGTNVTNVDSTSSMRPSSASNGGKVVNVTINVDGRNAQTDNALAEKIANAFWTQISMAVV